MSKVYILTHGTSNPDYGFERDGVRVFLAETRLAKC